ncbi:MAG: zf-HC2 domain-containing protein [Lentisphaerae bacterium]|nr:zf-HC2 domain-containing protein [Lentisphaerota bacterium]
MRCKTIERWTLLDRTGELSPRRHGRLQTHLKACDHCRAWRDSTEAITAAAHGALATGTPSEVTMVNIRREARLRAREAARKRPLTLWLRPISGLAAAALCLIAMGGWWMRPTPDPFDGQAQLSTILMMLTEEAMGSEGGGTTLPATADEPLSLDALASELLALQGMDASYTEAELREPGGVPQATDPLTRSRPALPARIYG